MTEIEKLKQERDKILSEREKEYEGCSEALSSWKNGTRDWKYIIAERDARVGELDQELADIHAALVNVDIWSFDELDRVLAEGGA